MTEQPILSTPTTTTAGNSSTSSYENTINSSNSNSMNSSNATTQQTVTTATAAPTTTQQAPTTSSTSTSSIPGPTTSSSSIASAGGGSGGLNASSSFVMDFLLLSEFSELEGPIPLFVIPPNGEGKFNLNDFVLRIMAVDYQNKGNDLASFSEDTQVVLTEAKENAVAYIHHFTLLDINARGYVRPICMSFITHDSKKIMTHFNDFLQQFTKVANQFKSGNREVFLKDLETRIADVNYTKHILIHQQQQQNQHENQIEQDSDDLVSVTPSTVSEILRDLKELHKRFYKNYYVNQKETQSSGTVTDEEDQAASSGGGGANGGSSSSNKGNNDENENEDEDDDLESLFRVIDITQYKPKKITSFHKTSYYSSGSKGKLRSLSELCGDEYYTKGVAKLKKMQHYFSRPSIVLQLEKEDNLIMSPSSSLLTIGQTILLNFNIEADRHARNMDAETIKLAKANSASNLNALLQAAKSSFSTVHESVDSVLSSSPKSSSRIRSDSDSKSGEMSSSDGELHSSGEKSASAIGAASGANGGGGGGSGVDGEAVADGNPSSNSMSSLGAESFNFSMRTSNTWQRFVNKQTKVHLESFASILWGYSKSNAGRGILELRNRYSFVKHIIFSLLKGRPVVIYAQPSNESLVKKLIVALSLFVPGHWRKSPAVVPWSSKPIRMADLACLKLVGLSKQKPISSAVEKYISKFDFENETLYAPMYAPDARVIEELLTTKKQWPDEDTYLAYIHFFLYDISTKACMYYHLCCVGLPQQQSSSSTSSLSQQTSNNNSTDSFIQNSRSNSGGNNNVSPGNLNLAQGSGSLQTKESKLDSQDKRSLSDSQLALKLLPVPTVREESKTTFFKKFNFPKNDVDIIEYLAEVVKEQQTLEIHGFEQVTPTIRLDYTPCQLFLNSFTRNIKK